jgi:hypothetical protein
VINGIEFSAKNLTSNAGLFLLLEHANKNGIFDLINHDLVFENESTNKIKMNHIKTMLCGNFVGIDKLERLKLLQSDPLINEFNILIKEPETVSRFFGELSATKQPDAERNKLQGLQKAAEKKQAQSHHH